MGFVRHRKLPNGDYAHHMIAGHLAMGLVTMNVVGQSWRRRA
jgi:hypothetical protein